MIDTQAPSRAHNFCAGPASLPTPVLLRAQQEMLDWGGRGVSVMEVSHRGADYIALAAKAEADLRTLMDIPDEYAVLFLQGGASLQFSALVMNLLQNRADYVLTGAWSAKAFDEAQRLELGDIACAGSSKDTGYTTMPHIDARQGIDYLHYCANETIHGVQMFNTPKIDAPLVCDMSSCILSEPINVREFGMIYAGAQKNIGPAGLTLVIIDRELLGRARRICPHILNYEVQTKSDSMQNTPATYSWYLAGLVFEWLLEQGGLNAIGTQNRHKAKTLYDFIDQSDFYSNKVDACYRSIMNVPFTLADATLDARFLQESSAAGLLNLKGHRVVGGMRASIYNAVPQEAVDALVAFMADFEKRQG